MAAKALIGRYLEEERGSTAIEYGLICALVFLGALVGMTAFGEQLAAMFSFVETTISQAIK